jgi:hypothetical protein
MAVCYQQVASLLRTLLRKMRGLNWVICKPASTSNLCCSQHNVSVLESFRMQAGDAGKKSLLFNVAEFKF